MEAMSWETIQAGLDGLHKVDCFGTSSGREGDGHPHGACIEIVEAVLKGVAAKLAAK